jgi:hypothetical protein
MPIWVRGQLLISIQEQLMEVSNIEELHSYTFYK